MRCCAHNKMVLCVLCVCMCEHTRIVTTGYLFHKLLAVLHSIQIVEPVQYLFLFTQTRSKRTRVNGLSRTIHARMHHMQTHIRTCAANHSSTQTKTHTHRHTHTHSHLNTNTYIHTPYEPMPPPRRPHPLQGGHISSESTPLMRPHPLRPHPFQGDHTPFSTEWTHQCHRTALLSHVSVDCHSYCTLSVSNTGTPHRTP